MPGWGASQNLRMVAGETDVDSVHSGGSPGQTGQHLPAGVTRSTLQGTPWHIMATQVTRPPSQLQVVQGPSAKVSPWAYSLPLCTQTMGKGVAVTSTAKRRQRPVSRVLCYAKSSASYELDVESESRVTEVESKLSHESSRMRPHLLITS